MARTLDLVHPAPLLCLHRTPGQARVDFAQVVTPVRIRSADPDAFEEVPLLDRASPAYAHDGSLWVRERAEAGTVLWALSAEERVRRPLTGALQPNFLRTPILAFGGDGEPRGDPPGTRRVRTVVRDYTDRAREAAADYVARNLRVVGGHVYHRRPGPIAYHAGTALSPAFAVDLGHMAFSSGAYLDQSSHVVRPRAERVAAFWDFEKAFHLAENPGSVRGSALERRPSLRPSGLEGHLGLGDPLADVMAFAWDAPGTILRNVVARVVDTPRIRAAAERVHPFAALGAIAATRPDEAEAAVLACCAFVDVVTEARPAAVPIGIRKLVAYGREIALPILRGGHEAVPEEDAEAIAAFGPGRA